MRRFKEGQRVFKARVYANNTYCKYGGDKDEVPLFTKGTIIACYTDDDLSVKFDNGKRWSVHPDELEASFESYATYEQPTTGESNMNEQIASLFPRTVDAVVVNKHFKTTFDNNPLLGIALKGKEAEVLRAAQDKEPKVAQG